MLPEYEGMTYEELEDLYHELSGRLEEASPDEDTYWELEEELGNIEDAVNELMDEDEDEYEEEDDEEEYEDEEFDEWDVLDVPKAACGDGEYFEDGTPIGEVEVLDLPVAACGDGEYFGDAKIPVDNKGASATAKKAEKIAGALIDEVKKPKKTTRRKKEDYTPYESPSGGAKPMRGDSGRVKPKKGAKMAINDLVRPLSPEIDAALNGGIPKGGVTEDGTVLNPRLVEVFKGAIEESNKTGIGIMDIFAVQYARMLARAAANPDAHQAFLQDPFSWAEGMIDTLITNSRKAKAGDAIAADLLERAYVSPEEAAASRNARANAGRMVAHPELRRFVTFARKWLRSVFGENADIYFIEDLTGETAEQLEVMEAAQAYGGRVNAMIITESGNVYVSKKANPVKVLHEVFGHGTWEWMKKNNPEGYEKLKELARKAPEEIKRRVKKNYEMDENSEEFLNEVFAHLIEAKYSGRIGTDERSSSSRERVLLKLEAFVERFRGLCGENFWALAGEFK